MRLLSGCGCRVGTNLLPDAVAVSFLQEDGPDHKGDGGNGHWIPQARVDVAGSLTHIDSDYRHQTAKYSVSYMVWQRERRIPDLCWICFDQVGRDWSVNHRDVEHLDEDE